LRFQKQEFETTLCFFHGALCGQVLQYVPDNWSPIRIVSFTGDKFQILNQADVSLELGRITELCLNREDIDYKMLSNMEFLIRLDIRNATTTFISLDTMIALEYIKLVDIVYKEADTALWIHNCPRIREVVLDKCFNVCKVFDVGEYDERFGSLNSLQKLFIKDCPDLRHIHCGMAEGDFPKLEMQVINCPQWRSSTWNHGGIRKSKKRKVNK
jgi:hypothetical protein